jgi:hypothetical protein
MPYRCSGAKPDVRTAAGGLEIVTGPGRLAIVGQLDITRDTATFWTRRGREQHAICGRRLVVARNAPYGDVAIWMELGHDGGGASSMRRIFGIPPGRAAPPHQLDAVFRHTRDALRSHGAGWLRATELGRGDHPMLLVECEDRHEVYVSRLFREHAELVMTVVRAEDSVRFHAVSRQLHVGSRVAVRVRGHDVCFVGDHGLGADMAGFPLPWLAPDERQHVARRLAAALDRSGPAD